MDNRQPAAGARGTDLNVLPYHVNWGTRKREGMSRKNQDGTNWCAILAEGGLRKAESRPMARAAISRVLDRANAISYTPGCRRLNIAIAPRKK